MVKGIEMVKYSSNNNTHNESQSRLFVSHFERTSPVNIIPHTYVLIYYYVLLLCILNVCSMTWFLKVLFVFLLLSRWN